MNSKDNTQVITKTLVQLFQQYGLSLIKTSKFEDYSLYEQNKSFFDSGNIITVPSASGRMLALKPDITLSIAKSIPKKRLTAFEKVYYIDDIYRYSKNSGEYSIVKQIGVEVMGPTDGYSNLEITNLAIEALVAIDSNFILDISHSGFVTSLLEQYNVSGGSAKKIMNALHHKAVEDIVQILGGAYNVELIGKLKNLIEISCSFNTALKQIKPLVTNDGMKAAYDELVAIGSMIEAIGVGDKVNLDFSVSGDVKYYNGLMLAGYIKGIYNKVLSGGRYDRLMEKLNKDNGAVGFAVDLSEFERSNIQPQASLDTVIFYDEQSDYSALMQKVRELVNTGKKVRTEKAGAKGKELSFKYANSFYLDKNQLKEI